VVTPSYVISGSSPFSTCIPPRPSSVSSHFLLDHFFFSPRFSSDRNPQHLHVFSLPGSKVTPRSSSQLSLDEILHSRVMKSIFPPPPRRPFSPPISIEYLSSFFPSHPHHGFVKFFSRASSTPPIVPLPEPSPAPSTGLHPLSPPNVRM